MKKQKISARAGTFGLLAFLAAGALAFSAASLSAQSFNFSEDFTVAGGSGTLGDLSNNWFTTTDSQFSDPITDIANDELRMLRNASNDSGITRRVAVNESGSDQWADYTIEAFVVADSDGNRHGIIGRWQGDTDVNSGYVARWAQDQLQIFRDFGGSNVGDTALGTVTTPSRSVTASETFRMTFDLSGDTLTAEVFEADGSGGFTDSIGAVTTSDSTYDTGSAGLATRLTATSRKDRWDDFSVSGTAKPEPGAYALLFGALSLGFVMLRRRRS